MLLLLLLLGACLASSPSPSYSSFYMKRVSSCSGTNKLGATGRIRSLRWSTVAA